LSAEPRRIVIAIDGPAGAGKSTIARHVAREMDYAYVDTGAMYRTVGLLASEEGIPLDDAPALEEMMAGLRFSFPWIEGVLHTVVNGRDVSDVIRTPEAALRASTVSKVPAVRALLVRQQREMARGGGGVMEGRDIGTVVFPDAELKVFLTASARVRGERRWKQMREGGDHSRSLEEVIAEIERRDHQDSTRTVAPLRPAEDSVVLDTSALPIGRVRQALLRLAHARQEDPDAEMPSPSA
jgi:cytidylate kinase